MKDEDVRKSAIIAQYDEVKHQKQSEKPIPYGTYEHLHSAIFNQTKPNSVKKHFVTKRIVAIAIAIILIAGAFVSCIAFVPEGKNLITRSTLSNILIFSSDTKGDSVGEIQIEYAPNGFVCDHKTNTSSMISRHYVYDNDEWFQVEKCRKRVNVSIDLEGYKEIENTGSRIVLESTTQPQTMRIVEYKNDYIYIITGTVSAHIDQNIMCKIADGVQ